MQLSYGVEIPPVEVAMFVAWSEMDPVSPWEDEREDRIATYSQLINPFVY